MRSLLFTKKRNIFLATFLSLLGIGLIATMPQVGAADNTEFSLQVSPSPLVTTLKPGETSTVELKIRNTGSQTERLKIEPKSFSVDGSTGDLHFDEAKKPEVANWLQFSAPTFNVNSGQIYTEKVTIAVPKDAGFSYAFAFVISRQDASAPEPGRQLKGSVAIFSLLTIDRPGATRELQLKNFSTSQPIYEYLPTNLTLELKNTGNTIVQPSGNVFIQRGSNDANAIGVLPVNQANGYILPGSTRKLVVSWDDGFQVLKSASDGSGHKNLDWNWSNLSHLRIGHYTAKVVAIYNDGQRDIPLTGEVSFWVIPWKLLLGVVIVVILIILGLGTLISRTARLTKKKKHVRF